MKTLIIATIAVATFAGAAQAAPGASNLEYLQAARCRGLSVSEGLGKVDTTAVDAFLRAEGGPREIGVKTSAANKITAATKEGDKADGAKKEKLLAERQSLCGPWLK